MGLRLKPQMAKKFTFGDVSLEVTAEPTYDEWAAMGPHVGRRERASKWWLGDWINYGEARYGEWMLGKYHYRSPAQVRRDLVGLDAAA